MSYRNGRLVRVNISREMLEIALRLPATARIERVIEQPDEFNVPIQIVVSSDLFPPVEEGQMIPLVYPVVTRHMTPNGEWHDWNWNLDKSNCNDGGSSCSRHSHPSSNCSTPTSSK